MSRTTANLLLLLTALIWGTTFVAQRLGMDSVGPFTYTSSRFLLGVLVIVPLTFREWRQIADQRLHISARDWLAWSGLGVVLFLGVVLQQIGLAYTSVSNAGFLTALYVPLVPLLGWLLTRQAPHSSVWPAAVASFVGTFLLSGGNFSAMNYGDGLVIISALFWAGHVLLVGRLAASSGKPILVAFTQFIVCGVLSGLVAAWQENITWAGLQQAQWAILYGGLLSVGVAFTLQVVAQRHSPPADAAVLLSSETLFAALAGALYLGERLAPIQMAGGALIFAAMLGVQLAPLLANGRKRRPASETT